MSAKKLIIGMVILISLIGAFGIAHFYRSLLSRDVLDDDHKELFLHIPTGSRFDNVMQLLSDSGLVQNPKEFRWLALQMKYDERVRPGRYRVSHGMNSRQLIALLRNGKQSPVKLMFQNVRTTRQLAGIISRQLETDSTELAELLEDDDFLATLGLNRYTAASLFIPNTYEFYWNTDAKKFIEKMHKEYKTFWNESRLGRANRIGLTPEQVSTLASIVERETSRNDEKPTVAGVYMNRLQKNWKLDADPTLIFAANDFTIRRVLNKHKQIDSPYNTYKYGGLPPGPICIPSISSLDAVLSYTKHEYMFFCAREDFSGYHNFAKTYSEHLTNARRFQKELDRRRINS
jgi:UPF0755 protein